MSKKAPETNRGYVLVMVLIFSIIIALIGAGLALITQEGFLSTRANKVYNALQKAAHYGINEALQKIVDAGGICEEGAFNGTFYENGAKVIVTTQRRGLVCIIRAEASIGSAKKVLLTATQSFYGIGAYTAKGNITETINGGLISGCDLENNCTIPGIITSGPIEVDTNVEQGSCKSTGTPSNGIFGSPPLKPKVHFFNLVPLVFNANCFYDLLKTFEKEDQWAGYPMGLGSNPMWKLDNGTSRQDITFDTGNLTACPDPMKVDEPALIMGNLEVIFPKIPSNIPSKCTLETNKNVKLDLAKMRAYYGKSEKIFNNCTKILIKGKNFGGSPSVEIKNASNKRVFLYVNGEVEVTGGVKNLILIQTQKDSDVTVDDGVTGPISIYSKGDVWIEGKTSLLRIVSKSNIYLEGTFKRYLSNSTLITEEGVENESNKLHLKNVNIFARYFNLGKSLGKVLIEGGMLYLYKYADKERDYYVVSNDCSYYGDSSCALSAQDIENIEIGTEDDPTLLMFVNSAAWLSDSNITLNGILFDQSVCIQIYTPHDTQFDVTGIYVDNFPNDVTLKDQISEGISRVFSYRTINILHHKFWFVKRFACIKDDPRPYTQAIQTLQSSY